MGRVPAVFWDSCVFYAFLNDDTAAYDVDGIAGLLGQARRGQIQIFTSSIALAEIVPSAIKPAIARSLASFLDDFRSAITVVTPSPTVMLRAGQLRDLPFRKPPSPGRRLATPDAIMLASCLELIEVHGIAITQFHTFDDGKKRDPVYGRMVPLLSFEEWCQGFTDEQMRLANKIIALPRAQPVYLPAGQTQ